MREGLQVPLRHANRVPEVSRGTNTARTRGKKKNQFPLLVIVPVEGGNMKAQLWLLRTDPLARVVELLSALKDSAMALK